MGEYDEKTKSVKLVFWKPYKGNEVPNSMPGTSKLVSTDIYNEEPKQDWAKQNDEKTALAEAPNLDLTTVYDPVTEGIKLVTWDEYLKENKPPKQDWTAEYDEKSASVKLVFWKPYQVVQKTRPISSAKIETLNNNLTTLNDNLTTVYDPATEGVKLISWDDYLKANKPPKQDWATEYDEKSQSVKLVFWKQYEHVTTTPSSISKTPANYTTVYDPLTQEVQLMDWDKYLEDHKPPKQDWAAEYDEKT